MNKKITATLVFTLSLILQVNVKSQSGQDPVGAIPGVIDVTPAGAATYTVPVEVVPGTGGMQPGLSVCYNSQSGTGALGTKWFLSGLSAVSRAPRSIYHDGNRSSVGLNGEDRFALDGNRLLQSSGGMYGGNGTSYVTEIESFSTIKHGACRVTGPCISRRWTRRDASRSMERPRTRGNQSEGRC